MTCGELDELRDGGGLDKAASAVREHLSTCANCRRLQELWNSVSEESQVPPELETRISTYVTGALKPVSPLPSNRILVAWLLGIALLAIAVGTWILGHKGVDALGRQRAAVMFGVLGICLLVAGYCVTLQMVPGSPQRLLPGASIGWITAGLIAVSLVILPALRDPIYVARGLHCWKTGLVCGVAAAVLLTVVLRRSAPINETKLYAASAFLAGLVGFGVLEMICPCLARTHVAVWHVGSALTFTLAGWLVGMASERTGKWSGIFSGQEARF